LKNNDRIFFLIFSGLKWLCSSAHRDDSSDRIPAQQGCFCWSD